MKFITLISFDKTIKNIDFFTKIIYIHFDYFFLSEVSIKMEKYIFKFAIKYIFFIVLNSRKSRRKPNVEKGKIYYKKAMIRTCEIKHFKMIAIEILKFPA